MKPKLICIDIDGTLLNSDHKILASTKEALTKIHQKNIIISLVSARMPKSINIINKELGLNVPFIAYNGALIFDTTDLIHESYIAPGLFHALFKDVTQHKVNVNVYYKDFWYVLEKDYYVEEEAQITKVYPEMQLINTELLRSDLFKTNGPNKLLLIGQEALMEQIEKDMQQKYSEHLNVIRSKPTYLEINDKDSYKSNAIKLFAKKYGINRNEIIAIGDNYNDIDMLQYAGLGIAMGNAPDKVKEVADIITSTNNENGIAKALEPYY